MSRARRRPLALLLALALVLGSGGAAWAYWTSSATATSSATSLTVAVTQADFPAAGYTYRNHDLRSTSAVTVTNTGQTPGTLTLALAATSGGAFAAAMPVTVWQVASAASCTAAATPVAPMASGTWESLSMTVPGTLAAGAATSFCVRTEVPSRQAIAATGGTQSSAATLTATLDDTAGWAGTVSAAGSATRTTELIYPYAQEGSANYTVPERSNWFTLRTTSTLCLDVSGSGGSGTRAITWTCHNDANQRWEIIPDPANPGFVQLRPKHNAGLGTRLTVTGSAVTIAITAVGSTAQRWEIQRIGDNAFQLVAHTTGECLTMGTASGDVQLVTAPCSATARATQTFTFAREPLTFAVSGTGSSPTVTFGVTAIPGTTYQVQRLSGTSTWNTITTTSASDSTSISFTGSTTNVPRGTTTTYRVVVTGTTTVVYSGIQLTRNSGSSGNTITATAGFG